MEEQLNLYCTYMGEPIKLTSKTPNLLQWKDFLSKQGVTLSSEPDNLNYNEFPNLSYYMKLKDLENQLIQLNNNFRIVRVDQIENEA